MTDGVKKNYAGLIAVFLRRNYFTQILYRKHLSSNKETLHI
jgi:hypothetical protein